MAGPRQFDIHQDQPAWGELHGAATAAASSPKPALGTLSVEQTQNRQRVDENADPNAPGYKVGTSGKATEQDEYSILKPRVRQRPRLDENLFEPLEAIQERESIPEQVLKPIRKSYMIATW